MMDQEGKAFKKQGGCLVYLSRRDFLVAGGASWTAWQLGVGNLWGASAGEILRLKGKARVQVAFVRPDVDRYPLNWPGTSYDIKARQGDYTKVLSEAAKELQVQLDIQAKPIADQKDMEAYIEEVNNKKPDGIILVSQCLSVPRKLNYWALFQQYFKKQGEIPTVVFGPMGTSFLHDLQNTLKETKGKKAFIASTQDMEWLRSGLRMLNTIWQMKQSRICVIQGEEPGDVVLDTIGTTLHYVRFSRFSEEYQKVKESDEVRKMAKHYMKNARKIVEPSEQDIIDAAKTYIVCRGIMEAEGCQGIAIDCLPHVEGRTAPPPCLAFSRLNDEGITAACQADWPAAVSLRLCYLLLDRPGFMQNITVNTVNNTLMGAHCTCPTLLAGAGGEPAPFALRNHSETDIGVAVQVLWPSGEPITIMKFDNPKWWAGKPKPNGEKLASSIVLGSGKVVCNIENPPSGGCRTSLEVKVDGVKDVRDMRALHHQLFILGDHKQMFKAYCELAGIEVCSV